MDATRYPIPAGRHRAEVVVRRSRFIASAAHAPDADAARAFVEEVRRALPDATHHCYAFVAGPPGSTARVGMSDDGEPHGTAGRPILNALLHADVGEIVVVCTRYFGGVKLGTGGLSRAYAHATTLALESLPTEEKVERARVLVRVAYSGVDALRRLVSEWGASVEDEEYGAEVRYLIGVPAADLAAFRTAVADVSQGRALIEDR
ncbi:MAG TPA: YigZ family protein [Longimicrobiales bacterium]|nr:YigZ family protein [Longimicrobiales bacterium]